MKNLIACSTALFFAFCNLAAGQGLLVNVNVHEHVALPRPMLMHVPTPNPRPTSDAYKIKELTVQATLKDQIARTQVSQSFVNTGSRQMEVCFVFPLPYDGAVDQLTLLIDGKEHPAKLLSATEARRLYENIVRKNRDPALLEWVGSGMFQTSVFPVPPGAERKVTLRYSQLCRRDKGLTDFLFPLSTAKYTSHPVEKLDIQLNVESSFDIKNVYSPSHAVEIKRPDNRHATVSFKASNEIPSTDFRLLYDTGAGQVGASVVSYRRNTSDEGFFLLLASPEIKAADQERPKKTVMFVVDRSGSMSGEKFEQAKGALRFVLNNLRDGDLFNIIAYDSAVESYRPELQKFGDDTRKSALGFVEGLYPGGSTNIHGALQAAMSQLRDTSRPTFLIFLTDGLPTDGETNEAKIVEACKSSNGVHARVFAFGVGYDVNSRLLDKLARANFGQSEYVRPNENIESRVSSFYARISAPVLSNVQLKFELDVSSADGAPTVNRVYPADVHDLFAGEQLVALGRYKRPGKGKLIVSGTVGDEKKSFDFPIDLTEKSADDTHAYVEKLWALRRVGEIIDQIDLKGKNEELVKELVELSTKHGIMTPYTSFLADENTDRLNVTENAGRANRSLESLSIISGRGGVDQRMAKQSYQRAENASGASFNYSAGDADSFYDISGLASRTSGPVAAPAGAAGVRSPADAKAIGGTAGTKGFAVQNVGRKTFYRRSGQWVDSSLTKDQEQKPIKIERYSREYFELVDRHGQEIAKYMTIEEPVIVEVAGQAYSF